LDHGGLPVGLFESAEYTDGSVDLRPGDILACFSDGITEATNRGGQIWDESEITKVLCDNRQSSSAQIVAKLVEGVDDYMQNREQADDITILIVRVLQVA
jgi:sigma-B regulation protein RsbU (phosphoserine phosphatase)